MNTISGAREEVRESIAEVREARKKRGEELQAARNAGRDAFLAERRAEREARQAEVWEYWETLSEGSEEEPTRARERRQWRAERGYSAITEVVANVIRSVSQRVSVLDFPTIAVGAIAEGCTDRFAAYIGSPECDPDVRVAILTGSDQRRLYGLAYRFARQAATDQFRGGAGSAPNLALSATDRKRLAEAEEVTVIRNGKRITRKLSEAEAEEYGKRRHWNAERTEGSRYGSILKSNGKPPAKYGEPRALQDQSDYSVIDMSRHSAIGVPEREAFPLARLSLQWAIDRTDRDYSDRDREAIALLGAAIDAVRFTKRRGSQRDTVPHGTVSLAAIGRAMGIHRGTAKRQLLRALAIVDREPPVLPNEYWQWRAEPRSEKRNDPVSVTWSAPSRITEAMRSDRTISTEASWLAENDYGERIALVKRNGITEADRLEAIAEAWWHATRSEDQRIARNLALAEWSRRRAEHEARQAEHEAWCERIARGPIVTRG